MFLNLKIILHVTHCACLHYSPPCCLNRPPNFEHSLSINFDWWTSLITSFYYRLGSERIINVGSLPAFIWSYNFEVLVFSFCWPEHGLFFYKYQFSVCRVLIKWMNDWREQLCLLANRHTCTLTQPTYKNNICSCWLLK